MVWTPFRFVLCSITYSRLGSRLTMPLGETSGRTGSLNALHKTSPFHPRLSLYKLLLPSHLWPCPNSSRIHPIRPIWCRKPSLESPAAQRSDGSRTSGGPALPDQAPARSRASGAEPSRPRSSSASRDRRSGWRPRFPAAGVGAAGSRPRSSRRRFSGQECGSGGRGRRIGWLRRRRIPTVEGGGRWWGWGVRVRNGWEFHWIGDEG